jgi:hypothetical protein
MTTSEKITFVKETSATGFINGFTGRTNYYRYIAMKGNKKGYLPNENKPYSPIGNIKALKTVIDILEWR